MNWNLDPIRHHRFDRRRSATARLYHRLRLPLPEPLAYHHSELLADLDYLEAHPHAHLGNRR
jgi:hypothetical protein